MGLNKSEMVLGIVEAYCFAHGREPVEASVIAAWAVETGRWEASKGALLKECQSAIAKAMREAKCSTPDGGVMRYFGSMQVVKQENGKQVQHEMWVDIRTAKYDQVRRVFQGRLKKVKEITKAYVRDVTAYNDNYLPKGKTPIQIPLSFMDDEDGESTALAS